jgi:hypothetical protein
MRLTSSNSNFVSNPAGQEGYTQRKSHAERRFGIAASLAPAVGFEPTTNRLTADRSTTELRWIDSAVLGGNFA